jgi:hypothetical protein
MQAMQGMADPSTATNQGPQDDIERMNTFKHNFSMSLYVFMFLVYCVPVSAQFSLTMFLYALKTALLPTYSFQLTSFSSMFSWLFSSASPP